MIVRFLFSLSRRFFTFMIVSLSAGCVTTRIHRHERDQERVQPIIIESTHRTIRLILLVRHRRRLLCLRLSIRNRHQNPSLGLFLFLLLSFVLSFVASDTQLTRCLFIAPVLFCLLADIDAIPSVCLQIFLSLAHCRIEIIDLVG